MPTVDGERGAAMARHWRATSELFEHCGRCAVCAVAVASENVSWPPCEDGARLYALWMAALDAVIATARPRSE